MTLLLLACAPLEISLLEPPLGALEDEWGHPLEMLKDCTASDQVDGAPGEQRSWDSSGYLELLRDPEGYPLERIETELDELDRPAWVRVADEEAVWVEERLYEPGSWVFTSVERARDGVHVETVELFWSADGYTVEDGDCHLEVLFGEGWRVASRHLSCEGGIVEIVENSWEDERVRTRVTESGGALVVEDFDYDGEGRLAGIETEGAAHLSQSTARSWTCP